MSVLHSAAAAHLSAQAASIDAYAVTGGRVAGSVAALLALAGVVIGGLTLRRSAARLAAGHGRRAPIVAVVTGSTGVVIGGLVLAVADGGPGTGNGVVGGWAAVAFGLIAVALGMLALARSRRTA